jgi:hypothetical protein
VTTLHDRLTNRFGVIRGQADDSSVLARELADTVTDWLASTELAETLLLSDPARQQLSNGIFRTESIVVTLIQEAEK